MKPMHIIAIVVALLLTTPAMAITPVNTDTATTQQVPQATMPGEFYGCQLGSTTFEEAKQKLTARKLTIENDGQNIMLMNSTFEQFQFSASLFMFSDKGIFNSITFLQSGMTKSEAIELSHRLQATLNSKNIMIKRVIDGFDCYFSSAGNITCQLSTQAGGEESNDYFVRLDFQVGTPDLTGSDK